jgi:hypothetical protein
MELRYGDRDVMIDNDADISNYWSHVKQEGPDDYVINDYEYVEDGSWYRHEDFHVDDKYITDMMHRAPEGITKKLLRMEETGNISKAIQNAKSGANYA